MTSWGPIPECREEHKWQIKGPECEIRCRDCNARPALPEVVQNEMIRELQIVLREFGTVLAGLLK